MTMLSVVIPAYNEERGIQDVLRRVLNVRPQLCGAGVEGFELIVVDDGSADRTAELVQAIPGARLLRHENNGGYGAALKTGFAAAQGEWIGFLDADGTYPPEYLPALCQAGLAENADIVIGSRMAGATSEMPAVRRLGNFLFAKLVSLVTCEHITDSASGMRIFRKSILERVYPLPDGLNLTPVMSTRALHEQLKMIEVAIPYSERQGRSKLSVVHDGMRFAQSIVWTSLSYNPVRLLGMVSLAALVLAGLIALGLIAARLLGVQSFSYLGAFAVFAAMVLAVAGVSILTLGISFNYFVALFHKEPVRQGLFGRPIFPQLEQHFGLVGIFSILIGILLALAGLMLGADGRPAARLWIYYLASASFTLIGIELIAGWVQIQVLDALRARDRLVAGDMLGKPATGSRQTPVSSQPLAADQR